MRWTILLSALFAISAIAQPAIADPYWHHDHGRHLGWNMHRDHYYYNPPRVIYRSPRPQVDYVYISNAPQTTYRQIRCTNEINPLGVLLGGTAGGVLGHQLGHGKGNTAATIGGAVIGSAIGAHSYTEHCTEEIFEQAPIGMPISWQGNDEYYQFTPTRDYRTDGRYCREYQVHGTVGGRTQDVYGTACLQPDGSWEIVN